MKNDKGFIKLSRKFFSNELWNEARTFSSCEAWLDLIQSARFDVTPRKESIGGREVFYVRGQYPASIRFLSKRWGWGEKRVRLFLSYLKKQGMITTDSSQGINIITLCNYEEYNSKDTGKGTAKDTPNSLNIKELQGLGAQQKTQARAQPQKEGHTRGTNTKKEKEEYKETSTKVEAKKDKLSSPSPRKKKSKKEEGDKKPLVYPFTSDAFMEAWEILRNTPKWKKKLNYALQISLNKLSKFEEEFAIKQIERAIESNWVGVVFQGTEKDYQEWLNQKNESNRKTNTDANQERKKWLLNYAEEAFNKG